MLKIIILYDNKEVTYAVLGANINRVLYFFFSGGKIILTHGFVKKTQKTPRSEIQRAKTFRKDWVKRNDN